MRKLMVLASAALVGSVAFADSIPRVYQYQANLKTTVAKNAATVTWTDDAGEKQTEQDICYRVKGTVTVKGVIVLGCDCNDFDGDLENLEDGYPLVLMATSADKYTQVVFANDEDTWIGGANRFGSPLSCKATSAELEFDVGFRVGPANSCTRYFELWNAGFGTASKLEAEEGYDITSLSGSTAGWADAPYCSAAQNNCPRCVADDDCDFALAFAPCSGSDCTVGIDDDEGLDYGVVYGTFTLKYNKALSGVIKPIAQSDVQGTINALVPKAFGKQAVAPIACGGGGMTLDEILAQTAVEDTWLTANPFASKHDGGWVWSGREDRLYAIYGEDNSGRNVYRIDHIGHTAAQVATLTYNRHGSHPVIDSDGIYVYFPPSQSTPQLERLDTRTDVVDVMTAAPANGTFSHGAWKNNRLWIVLDNGILYNWDPDTDTWTDVHNFGDISQVVEHGTTASNNIYIWVTESEAFYSYDTVSTTLTQLADFTTSADLGGNGEIVFVPESCSPANGFIYAMSGCGGEPRYYSIATDTWYELSDPHFNDDCVGHGTYDRSRQRLYVAGGDDRVWYYQY